MQAEEQKKVHHHIHNKVPKERREGSRNSIFWNNGKNFPNLLEDIGLCFSFFVTHLFGFGIY